MGKLGESGSGELTSKKASNSLNDCSLSIVPMKSFHASPMLIAPSCRGETRRPEVLLRIRYLPNSVAGCLASANRDMFAMCVFEVCTGREVLFDSSGSVREETKFYLCVPAL